MASNRMGRQCTNDISRHRELVLVTTLLIGMLKKYIIKQPLHNSNNGVLSRILSVLVVTDVN